MNTLEQFMQNASAYTQKRMFSLMSTMFDPLGIMSPLMIRIKMLLQQVWKLGKKWDEPRPAEIHSNLQKSSIVTLQCLISKTPDQENNHQLHDVVDASTVALAAVAYICT